MTGLCAALFYDLSSDRVGCSSEIKRLKLWPNGESGRLGRAGWTWHNSDKHTELPCCSHLTRSTLRAGVAKK